MDSNHFLLLNEWIKETLIDLNIKKPTEIQSKTFSSIMKKESLIAIAPTGTGKTLSYLLPHLSNIDFKLKNQVLILVPTRELARQIFSVLASFKKHYSILNVKLLIGGVSKETQMNKRLDEAHILVGTPTRIRELYSLNLFNFKDLKAVVYDEADMLMDLGFANDLDFIMSSLSKIDPQKLCFSATINDLLANQLKKYFDGAKIINTGSSIYTNNNIKHYIVHNNDKLHSLAIITKTINPYCCLVFCNTKKKVDEIFKYFKELGRSVTILHGSLKERERKNTLKEINSNHFQYVICSDIASRGLDINGVSHVINYDLPNESEWYIHRAGRSGRGKYTGESYVLYDGKQDEYLSKLEKRNIPFHHLKVTNNTLVPINFKFKTKKKIVDYKTEAEIKKKLATIKKKVKPGYQKKIKEVIKEINQKNKRAHIEKKMKAERIKKYKMENASKKR